MGVSGGGWGGLLARGDGGGVGWRSRVELQSTEVEVDRGLEMLAVAVAAGQYPDGLDAGVQAFGAGVGDRVGEVGQQSRLVTLQCLSSVDDRHGIPQAPLQEFQSSVSKHDPPEMR